MLEIGHRGYRKGPLSVVVVITKDREKVLPPATWSTHQSISFIIGISLLQGY